MMNTMELLMNTPQNPNDFIMELIKKCLQQIINCYFCWFSLLCIKYLFTFPRLVLHFLLYFQLIAFAIQQQRDFNIKNTSLFIPRYYQYLISMGKRVKKNQDNEQNLSEISLLRSGNGVMAAKKRFIKEKYILKKRICLKNSCDVLKAQINNQKKQEVIIKVMMSTVQIQHIAKEIFISKTINSPFCSRLIDAFESQNHICLVTNYIKSNSFHDIMEAAQPNLLKNYMTSLLNSVQALKNHQIVHRDIKPDNFLFDMDTLKGQLIDFGLAQFQKECIIGFYGTQGYEPLQVALNVQAWSYSSQMWAVGVIMLHIMTRKYQIFHECIAKQRNKQRDSTEIKRQNYLCSFILELSIIFGKANVINQCKKFGYNLILPSGLKENPLDLLIQRGYGVSAIDLLKKLLALDPQTRITVEQALKHPFIQMK